MRRTVYAAMILVIPFAARADDKVVLSYKATAGSVARYKSEGTLKMDLGGNKVTLDLKETEKVTFTTVTPAGDITLERESESSETSLNGTKVPASEGDKEKTTVTIHKDGAVVSYKSSHPENDKDKTQVRLFTATSPVFTDKPVGVGDKWIYEYKSNAEVGVHASHADYEVLAFEKVAGVDSVKIKMAYKETEGSPAVTSTTTLWLEKDSGDTLKGEYEVENLTFNMGGQNASAGGKVTSERTAGSPMGGKVGAAEAKKEKTIDETVKDGFEKIPGCFTLYRKKEAGRDTLYMEIKEAQLDKLMLMEVTASTGTSDMMVAGNPINDILFKFSRSLDDKILFHVPNINFRVPADSPISRAVKRSFADAYLEAYKIEAKQEDRKSLLINVSDLFRGDIAEISQAVSGGGSPLSMGRGGGYSMDREKTFVVGIKNFPENLVVESQYHFTRAGSGGGIAALLSGTTLADPRSAPIRVVYTLFPLPDTGYKPRLADPRVGYFLTDYEQFGNDRIDDPRVHYILRWQVEKADPKAAMSPPKKPIVFWLDNAIPFAYRDAVRDGILYWNKAFEKVGIKDAIEVKTQPDTADWDHADMRYNLIRWVTSPWRGGAYAVALFRENPITGQILNANITVDANYARAIYMEKDKLIDPSIAFQQAADPSATQINPRLCNIAEGAVDQAWFGFKALGILDPSLIPNEKSYVDAYLRETVAHEMGHCLGLRHNFIASTYHSLEELKNPGIVAQTGICASVMDYEPFNISALKTKGVDYYTRTIGPYDMWAIKYGYVPVSASAPDGELYWLNQIASDCNKPGHAYQSDEIADQFDPHVVRFDLGRDPLAYWTRMMQVTRYLLLNLGDREPKRGETYWKFTRDFNRLLNMYARGGGVASRYIGALHVNRNHRGDAGEKPTLIPVDAEHQRQALNLLNQYLFDESAFAFVQKYAKHLTADPFPTIQAFLTGGLQQDFPVMDTVSNLQQTALKRLFNPSVLTRLVNNEFKAGDPSKALTLPTLFHSVSANVWAELDSRRDIPALRRQLQRAHLDTMVSMVVNPTGSAPEDAKMLAWDQLRSLKGRIASAKTRGHDEYTRVHLDESLMRINRALEAKQMIGGPAAAPVNPLAFLLGGKNAEGEQVKR